MGELALKVVTGDVEFLLEKNDIGSQYGCVLAVSQSGSVLSSGLKVGALIVSVGGIPLSGLNREELRTLINDSTNSGELKLKIMDNEGERYCSFPLETSDKEICQTVDKDTELKPDRLELENLRIIHKQAYRSSPDSVRSQHNSQNTSVDTRGPQINFKPKHSSVCPAVTDSYGSHLGAVAKLAIDGGLTTDQLLQIGSSDINQPGHYLYQSSINCDQKCVAPDLKYSSSDPRDAKFLTAHSSAPYSQICRISPGGNRRPVLHSSSQSVQFVRSPGISATHNQSRVTISPNHPTPGYHRSSQWCTPRDNPSTWSHVSSNNRVSFPAQMTRVGGLVFTPGSPSLASDNFNINPVGQNQAKPYQSVSACTSPTNLKYTVSSHSPSTSFFSCSNVPSPSNTPPLASTFVTDNIGATDIVRLGPGNIVTRAPAGSTVYSPSSLIRMHYSPKPYVGMGITGTPYVPVVSTLTISNLNVPSPVLSDGSDTCLCSKPAINSEPNISTTCLDLGTTKTPEPIFRCSTSSPSPTEMSPSILNRPGIKRNYANPTLRSSAPVTSASQYIPTAKNSITDSYLPHPKPFNSHNSPSSQVARTVRHLRRIRHIFGDSIGYTSSVTSASTGALTDEDKDSVCSPKVGHLRSHGYHSVESVRRSSLLCDCSPDHIRDMNDKKSIQINNSYPSHAVIASINWNDSETQDFKKSLLWYNYHMVLSGQTLVLTREKDLSQVDPSDNLDHVHIPLSGESIVWHSLTELPGFTCPSSSHCNPKTGVIGVLNSSKLNLTCCLHFPDRQTACCIFDHFGPQKARKDSKEKQSTAPSSQTALPLHGSRSKFPSGRSSLGLAGPSGVTPLFKAMGTAAASVGLQLTDYVNLPSALHLVPTSQTSTSAGNGDVSKSKGDQALTTKLSYSPDSTTQSNKSKELRFLPSYPRGRGRLQQALTRMRRAATASCDPTSRSNSNVTTRRFASSHGFGKSKSSLISSPVKTSTEPINCSIELENSSNITYQSSDHSPFALLLATSVSPSPSLQTSCLTCMPVEPNEPVNINSNSSDLMEESQEHSNNDIYHQQNAGMTSSQQSKWEYKATSQLTVLISENTQEMVSDGDVDKNRIKFMQSEKSRHHFIPLPLHVCGPLPLHKCPRSTLSPFVPFVVELCVTLVERYGLNCIGIYRLSGSKVAHDFITSELSRDITTVDVMSDKWNDLHAVCGVLKTFLRNLPDSLFPKVMYPDFLAACRLPQREKRLLSIQRLLSIMECYPCHPEYRAHRATLRYLATHLARVSAREAVNKMTAYNLALVFAPNLVQPCEDSPELLMSDSKYKIMLVETVIKYHAWIFSPDLGLESGCSVPPDSTEDLTPEIDVSNRAVCETSTTDSDDSIHQPGRLEGDVQPLVAELLNAAASLPPPPSDTDLETAEIPGPESDRPSDIIMSRPRFTSIPTSSWSTSGMSISRIPSGGLLNEMTTVTDNLSSLKMRPEINTNQSVTSDMDNKALEIELGRVATNPSLRSLQTPLDLGTKLDNLRHLSQGCLEQYTSEARRLGVRVAESRRQLESTVAQRLHAEQLLLEARSECLESHSVELIKTQSDLSTGSGIQSQNLIKTLNSTQSTSTDVKLCVIDDKSSSNYYP